MANTQRPFGFRPVQTRNGSPWCGKTQKVIILASDTNGYFVGDLVKFTGDQAVSPIDGKYYQVITKAVASDVKLAGAVTGVSTTDSVQTQYLGHRPAAAQDINITCEIPEDADVIYIAQEDSVGGAMAVGAAGSNVNFVVGSGGDTATNTSSYALDSSTVATTSTLPIRVISYDDPLSTESGAYALWRVTINQDAYSDKTGV